MPTRVYTVGFVNGEAKRAELVRVLRSLPVDLKLRSGTRRTVSFHSELPEEEIRAALPEGIYVEQPARRARLARVTR